MQRTSYSDDEGNVIIGANDVSDVNADDIRQPPAAIICIIPEVDAVIDAVIETVLKSEAEAEAKQETGLKSEAEANQETDPKSEAEAKQEPDLKSESEANNNTTDVIDPASDMISLTITPSATASRSIGFCASIRNAFKALRRSRSPSSNDSGCCCCFRRRKAPRNNASSSSSTDAAPIATTATRTEMMETPTRVSPAEHTT
jgi:hypothetical protein